MRIARSLLALLLFAVVAGLHAPALHAQDGSVVESAAFRAAGARHQGATAALTNARTLTQTLTGRRDELAKAEALVAAELADVEAAYAEDGPPPYTLAEVGTRVDDQTAALAKERSPLEVDVRLGEQRAVVELQTDADSRLEGLTMRYREWRAEARAAAFADNADTAEEAWDAERLRWDEREAAHRNTLDALRTEARAATRLHEECSRLRGTIRSERGRILELLKANNLLLRGASRITPASLSQGIRDLSLLPGLAVSTWRGVGDYLSDEDERGDVLGFGCAALGIVLLLLLGRARLARRFRLAAELATERDRVVDLVLRLLGGLAVAGCLAAVPFLAAELLGGISIGLASLLRTIAVVLGACWLARGIAARLLPSGAAWTPLGIDARTAALLRTGVHILVVLTVVLLPATLALEKLGHPNQGAIEALFALYELGVVLTLLLFFFRRSVVLALLPSEAGRAGRVLRRVVGVLHPVLVLVGPVVLVLDLLSYDLLAEFLTRLVGGTVVAVAAGAIVYGALWRGLEAWLRTVIPEEPGAAGGGDGETQLDAAVANSRYLLRVLVLIGAVFLMLLVQGGDFATLRSFLEVDLPFQGQVEGRVITWWNVLSGVALITFFLSAVGHVKLFLERFVLPRTGLDPGLRYTISTLTGYIVAALGLYVGLLQVFDLSALGYVFAALSVGIGFGLQEIVSNFVSGLILLFERPLKVGDLVTVGETEGWVTKINIRATTIQTRDNVSMLIPNKDFITQAVVNSDYGDAVIRLRVSVGVAYGSDTALVRTLLHDVGAAHPRVLRARKVDVLFRDFGASSLDFELRVWIPEATEHPTIASELRYAIDAAFRANGIEIPFSQHDLHLRSVDAGAARQLRGDADAGADEVREP